MNRVVVGLLGGLVAIAAVIAPATAASAAPGAERDSPAGVYADPIQTFKNRWTGRCLDDSYTYGLRTFGCNGLDYQRWYVHVWADGTRRLRNVHTGRCIYDSDAILTMRTCDSSTNQSFYVKRYSDGSVRFRNQNTRLCLAGADNGAVYTPSCTDVYRQRWR